MRARVVTSVVAACLASTAIQVVASADAHADSQPVNVWLTTDNLSSALAPQAATSFGPESGPTR